MDKREEIVYNKNILEMLTVANEYCLFLEGCEKYKKEDVISFLIKVSPLLYLKGSMLPLVEVENEEANERFVVEVQWENVYNLLKEKLGKNDLFWKSTDPNGKFSELLQSSISEHFADVYQDLKDFVYLYQKNSLDAKENAVAECKRLHRSHWGPRLLDAMHSLHHLVFGKEIEDENTADPAL